MYRLFSVSKASLLLLLLATFPYFAHAQTTISGLDDDPVTSPNDTYNNNRAWAWETGPEIGCGSSGCFASADMGINTSNTMDGRALDTSLFISNCSSDCYSDALFSNRIFHNDGTADGATSFTLDLYNTVDNNVSQALEYIVEQDVFTGSSFTKHVFSFSCDFADGIWQVWDGNANGGGGGWVNPNGANIPCVPFQPAGVFAHFIFNFSRPDQDHMYYSDFWVNDTHRVVNYTAGATVVQSWEEGLITWLQLDGDFAGNNYTATSDLWNVTYQ